MNLSTIHPIALTALLCSSAFNSAIHAQSTNNLLQNGSFEIGPSIGGAGFTHLPNGSTDIPGWIVINDEIDYIGNYWNAPEGSRSLDLHGDDSSGGVLQTVATEPGRMYRLSFELAGNPMCGADIMQLNVTAGTASSEFTFDTTGHSRPDIGWTANEWWFVAEDHSTEIRLFSGSPPSYCGPAIDDVVLEEFDLQHNLLINPGAEDGLNGWTPSNSGFSTRDSNPPAIEGQWYFYGGAGTAASEAFQDVDVSEWSPTIDNGEQYFYFEGYVAQWHAPPPLDVAIIRIDCLDSIGSILNTWSTDTPQSEKNFEVRTLSQLVPPDTRTIRVTLIAERFNGSNCDGYFDDLFLALAPQRVGLTGDSSIAIGEVASYQGRWAVPNEYVWFLIGGAFTPGNGVAIPGCPGLLADLSDVRQYRYRKTDENGRFHMFGRFPAWAAGRTVFLQAVDPLNCRLSNVVTVEVQ